MNVNILIKRGAMDRLYRCPVCKGTEVVWDRGTRQIICPNDKTPVKRYKLTSSNSA